MLHQIDRISGIGLHLDSVLRKVQLAYLKQFEALGIDMTIEQWVILHQVLELGDAASQRDIVQSNFRNRATISRVIAGLERKGWLAKSRFEGDQKRFKLSLTTAGADIVDRVLPHAVALRKRAVKDLDEGDFKTFLTVLDQIGSNYD
ncbi:MAG: winged helix DNA-binding protein [Flavobacteriaceae bacterium]|nr:winged helix DNA-binding protein [Flavobacteriaceae bacterium]